MHLVLRRCRVPTCYNTPLFASILSRLIAAGRAARHSEECLGRLPTPAGLGLGESSVREIKNSGFCERARGIEGRAATEKRQSLRRVTGNTGRAGTRSACEEKKNKPILFRSSGASSLPIVLLRPHRRFTMLLNFFSSGGTKSAINRQKKDGPIA
jgi:hypothetical protein